MSALCSSGSNAKPAKTSSELLFSPPCDEHDRSKTNPKLHPVVNLNAWCMLMLADSIIKKIQEGIAPQQEKLSTLALHSTSPFALFVDASLNTCTPEFSKVTLAPSDKNRLAPSTLECLSPGRCNGFPVFSIGGHAHTQTHPEYTIINTLQISGNHPKFGLDTISMEQLFHIVCCN